MTRILKPLGQSISLSATPNNIDSAKHVRLLDTAGADSLITVKEAGGNTVSSFYMTTGEVVYMEKEPTYTIEVNSGTVYAVAVAFRG